MLSGPMPTSDHRRPRRRPNARTRRHKIRDRQSQSLAAPTPPDPRRLLARILDSPQIATVVPHLQPEVLQRVIQTCGLEDCAELVALATSAQLERVFDLDLWRSAWPGADDELDPQRFGTWLDVLLEAGESVAAAKLAGIDAELVIAAFAQHVRVFDRAAISAPDGAETTEADGRPKDSLSCEIGGYVIEPRRRDAWQAIVTVLVSLDGDHPDYFHRVMSGCRRLSNAGWELDGLDDLLSDPDQDLFDLAVDREGRREQQGFVPPAQARAFLQSARQVLLSDPAPQPSPLARAYFRGLDRPPATRPDAHAEPPTPPALSTAPNVEEPSADTLAAIMELLGASDRSTPRPRALLQDGRSDVIGVSRFEAHMQFVCDTDSTGYTARSEEYAYLVNTMVAGCSIRGRAFTPREASDAAAAICSLGMENWPPHWLGDAGGRSPASERPEPFPTNQDLIAVFQVGWTILYTDVVMRTADRLIDVLSDLHTDDSETRAGLDELRVEMTSACRAGTPWRAVRALDVVLVLDQPAWATLIDLISEFPVMHAGLTAARRRTHTVDPSRFEFISDNRQIAAVHEFLESLPEILAPC
jgi:uncharacterized protein DUF6178